MNDDHQLIQPIWRWQSQPVTGGNMNDAPYGQPLTVEQLAQRWSCSHNLIYGMLNAGKLGGIRLGRLWRIPIKEIIKVEEAGSLESLPAKSSPRDGSKASAKGTDSERPILHAQKRFLHGENTAS